jgi:hypothetical protein
MESLPVLIIKSEEVFVFSEVTQNTDKTWVIHFYYTRVAVTKDMGGHFQQPFLSPSRFWTPS